MPFPFAQIALNLPLADTFDYAVPAAIGERLRLGARVGVPFGRRRLIGYCVRFLDAPTIDPARVKPIDALVDEEPLVDAAMLDLTRWIADYYGCSWGEALEAALPAGVRHAVTSRTIQIVEPVLNGAELQAQIAAIPPRLKKRAALLSALASVAIDSTLVAPVAESGSLAEPTAGGPLAAPTAYEELTPLQLAELAGCSATTVEAARRDGLVRFRQKVVTEHPIDDVEPETPPPIELTDEQQKALAVIRERRAAGFGVILLHGVTGSGKTEVYLRAIAEAVAEGKQALVLVPEIALTPQTIRRFKGRFARLAVLHSHLTAGQRYEQWLGIHRGEADVVIGARSAVFAPMSRLGLVVVDEEHENTFKQETDPRYHARDVAIVRASKAGALVVLGSATPSLESFHNARRGRYVYVRIARRVLDLPMPPVDIVDMTAEMSELKRFTFISRRLEALVRQALDSDAQVMLFLNRRGYTTLVLCPRCQHALTCPKCRVPMVYHRRRNIALCHYCGEHQPATGICPACLVGQMRHFGVGTERIEDEIARKFPSYPVARMDSDTTRGRVAHQRLLDRFRSGDARILVGTQMIAKGLDFPQVTLVGVISADTALYLPDFRSAERTFQLIEQVAGRAGRGPRGGRVVVQTANPQHFSILAAARHDYFAFAETELGHRRELGYPPFGHLLRVVVTAKDRATSERICGELAEVLHGLPEASPPEGYSRIAPSGGYSAALPPPGGGGALTLPAPSRPPAPAGGRPVLDAPRPSSPSAPSAGGLEILGPAECPLANLQGKSRWQLLIKAPDRKTLHAATRALRPRAAGSKKAQIALDVDPVSMM